LRHMAATTKPFSRVRTTSTDVTRSVTSAGIRLISRETAVMGADMVTSIGRSGENRKLFLLGRRLDDTNGLRVERYRFWAMGHGPWAVGRGGERQCGVFSGGAYFW
jgi:hypothetical protein